MGRSSACDGLYFWRRRSETWERLENFEERRLRRVLLVEGMLDVIV